MCGGTTITSEAIECPVGLSPRVRGNLFMPDVSVYQRGSIPACAGEPDESWEVSEKVRVYPRVCGGTFVSGLERRQVQGLSPRVRGNLDPQAHRDVEQGSIPACAGEPPRYRHRRWYR